MARAERKAAKEAKRAAKAAKKEAKKRKRESSGTEDDQRKNKRGYNVGLTTVAPTKEEMDEYTKSKTLSSDPMANLGGEELLPMD